MSQADHSKEMILKNAIMTVNEKIKGPKWPLTKHALINPIIELSLLA